MKRVLSLFFVLILFFSLSGCSKKEESKKLKVAATIFPLYSLIEEMPCTKNWDVEVKQILPAGASPHTFELTLTQIKELQDVKIIFMIGHGLDDWALKIKDSIPGVELVTVDNGIEFLDINGEESSDGKDPHYWLSAKNAIKISDNISDKMAELGMTLDNKNLSSCYNDDINRKQYSSSLDTLDLQIKEELKDIKTNKIVTFHEAWGYFAKDYGLEIEGTFEPFPGKEPTVKYLQDLNNTVKQNNIRSIFSEPQMSNATIQPFVNDLGLKLFILDPIGGVVGRNSYMEMMKYNAGIFKEALSQ